MKYRVKYQTGPHKVEEFDVEATGPDDALRQCDPRVKDPMELIAVDPLKKYSVKVCRVYEVEAADRDEAEDHALLGDLDPTETTRVEVMEI
jgi:hypothetical protein